MTHFKKYFNAFRLLTAIVAVTAATTVQAQYWDLFYDFAGDFHDGLAKVSLNDKWGYLNNLGAEAVQCIYQNAGDFNNGRAKVQRQGKWGFVNVNGAEVIPCKYDEIGPFDEDFMAKAKVNGKIGYIGMRGEVIPCIYED
ncbi:MAG: WG repeat-containing protein [Muribaculaceae bacterium]|nr:WG repeat-containing protein [Muribaculaceae bacterium]